MPITVLKAQLYTYDCVDSLIIHILVYQITYTKNKKVLNKSQRTHTVTKQKKISKEKKYKKNPNKIMTMTKMLYKYYYAAFLDFLCHRESNNKKY